jgi:hypothetical protein
MDNLELKAFMAPIFKYGIATACLMAAASMLVIGWDPFFVYGLTLGTSVSIVNHILLAYTANLCLSVETRPDHLGNRLSDAPGHLRFGFLCIV